VITLVSSKPEIPPMISEKEAALFLFRVVLYILRPDIKEIEQRSKKVASN
jgi:hypothetical protein